MVVNLPAVALTAVWALVTAIVYWLLMKWSGPVVAWTVVPGIARGVRDWVANERRVHGASGTIAPVPGDDASRPGGGGIGGETAPGGDVAEVIDL